METKSIVIDIPDGMCIDESKSTFEKIVFKKKDTKPRSWEEYCNNYVGKVFYIDKNSDICGGDETWGGLFRKKDKNTLPSKELAESFLAMMQLMSLRQAWVGDWEPDWDNVCSDKYCILGKHNNDFEIRDLNTVRCQLSFPTEEMAGDFRNCFKDLLNVAKPLI